MANAVAENVLGTIGTVLWCIQLIPQVIRNYRAKNCEGLPLLMMFLWAASGVPFSIYFIATDGSIPLRIQPQLFTFSAHYLGSKLCITPKKVSRTRLVTFVGALLPSQSVWKLGLSYG